MQVLRGHVISVKHHTKVEEPAYDLYQNREAATSRLGKVGTWALTQQLFAPAPFHCVLRIPLYYYKIQPYVRGTSAAQQWLKDQKVGSGPDLVHFHYTQRNNPRVLLRTGAWQRRCSSHLSMEKSVFAEIHTGV